MEDGKIGIGITTHNRKEVFEDTIKEIKKYLPKNSELVIVDDTSEPPIKEATFRFEENAGIARVKNKCLELLLKEGCEELFLFDDDIYPIKHNWWAPYIESNVPHLMYIFTHSHKLGKKVKDINRIYHDGDLEAFDRPRGCMMYINKAVIDSIGGFDTNFNKYGWEHENFSLRACKANLTPYPFMDVKDSDKLFYSLDEHGKTKSSVNAITKLKEYNKHKAYFDDYLNRPLKVEF